MDLPDGLLDLDSVQENSNQVPVLSGTAYNGIVTTSAGVSTACTLRDCTVELATLQIPRFRFSRDLVPANTPLRLATSRDVAPGVSASEEAMDSVSVGEGEAMDCVSGGEEDGEVMDVSGRSDDSDLDPGYQLPKVLSSESESDPGEVAAPPPVEGSRLVASGG